MSDYLCFSAEEDNATLSFEIQNSKNEKYTHHTYFNDLKEICHQRKF